MGNMKQIIIAGFLLILSVLTLAMTIPAYAQSISKPSTPEFTLRYVEHPYDVAPTYQIDQYSGANMTIQAGSHIQNRSIEIIIKNPIFTSYQDTDGNKIQLFYNVSAKGHYGTQWYYYPTWLRTLPVSASEGENTVLSFGLDVNYEEDNQYGFWYGDLSSGDQVDFRVQALVGYYTYPAYNRVLQENTFNGVVSDWSDIKTIDIPQENVSPSPTVPEFSIISALPLLAVIPLIMTISMRKKIKKVEQKDKY
jgi:hypothetical protein